MARKVYTVKNLDCAGCAAAVERKIAAMPEVHEATLTFATKQLRVTAEDSDSLLDKMKKVASAAVPGVEIFPRAKSSVRPADAAIRKTPAKGKTLRAENRRELIEILAGAILFSAGLIFEHFGFSIFAFALSIVSYLILGGIVVLTALKNIANGNVFDENFLMSIATLGAFAIQDSFEGVGVMLFYRIGRLFEEIAVERSRSQIMDAVDMRPEVVAKIHGNHTHMIPAGEARVGDLIQIKPGDRIPLDCIIVNGSSRIDTSPVTGEPVPVPALEGDSVTSGCMNISGLLQARVEKVLEESMVTKILNSVENAAAGKPQIERLISHFARIYTPIVVTLAIATAIIPSLLTGNWNYWIYTAITFLVISCPCALVLSVPLAFFSGIGSGSRKGILFKSGASLEAMNQVKVVVMDKTGTITKGNFVLHEAVPAEGVQTTDLLRLCASCESSSTHPIAHSIVAAAKSAHIRPETPICVEETAGCGIKATLSSGEVLCGSRTLMEQYKIALPKESSGFGTEVYAAKDGKYIGRLRISDTIKEDARTAITKIKHLGFKTAMLTGDAANSAAEVARETGIDEVYERLLPQDKVTELFKIRKRNGAVMFVGDGMNDAPVLAGADVGAAMGSGADAAIEAADVVFMTSGMEAIPQALGIAKASNNISRQNLVFALVVKALVMILGLAGFANMWMAVFADTGVAMLCVLNSVRLLYRKETA